MLRYFLWLRISISLWNSKKNACKNHKIIDGVMWRSHAKSRQRGRHENRCIALSLSLFATEGRNVHLEVVFALDRVSVHSRPTKSLQTTANSRNTRKSINNPGWNHKWLGIRPGIHVCGHAAHASQEHERPYVCTSGLDGLEKKVTNFTLTDSSSVILRLFCVSGSRALRDSKLTTATAVSSCRSAVLCYFRYCIRKFRDIWVSTG